MRFAPETLFLFLVAAVAGAGPQPPPSPSPSPSPTPRYKLAPYGFESAKDRSTVPLLRFEDETEVRSLEMNAAIARFFDKGDEKGNMLRGATPGGAPTLREMAAYRPHVTPAINLLGAAALVVQEVKKQVEKRRHMPAADPPPSAPPTPSPTARP